MKNKVFFVIIVGLFLVGGIAGGVLLVHRFLQNGSSDTTTSVSPSPQASNAPGQQTASPSASPVAGPLKIDSILLSNSLAGLAIASQSSQTTFTPQTRVINGLITFSGTPNAHQKVSVKVSYSATGETLGPDKIAIRSKDSQVFAEFRITRPKHTWAKGPYVVSATLDSGEHLEQQFTIQ